MKTTKLILGFALFSAVVMSSCSGNSGYKVEIGDVPRSEIKSTYLGDIPAFYADEQMERDTLKSLKKAEEVEIQKLWEGKDFSNITESDLKQMESDAKAIAEKYNIDGLKKEVDSLYALAYQNAGAKLIGNEIPVKVAEGLPFTAVAKITSVSEDGDLSYDLILTATKEFSVSAGIPSYLNWQHNYAEGEPLKAAMTLKKQTIAAGGTITQSDRFSSSDYEAADLQNIEITELTRWQ